MIQFPKQRLVRKVFSHEDEIRRAIFELRNDTPRNKVAIRGHAFISNPTEQQALKNITPIHKIVCDDGFWLNDPERWLKVINKTYDLCPDMKTKKVLQMLGRGFTPTRISIELNMNRTSIYDLRIRLHDYACCVASQLGLIDVIGGDTDEDDKEADEDDNCNDNFLGDGD